MSKIKLATSLLLGAALLVGCNSKDKPSATLATPQGQIVGVKTETGIDNFKGIPYATPPVGDLRWAPPGPAPTWTDIRTANMFSPICMQSTATTGEFFDRLIEGHGLSGIKTFIINRAVAAMGEAQVSEDCLYLNVRTPNLNSDGTVDGNPLPVMVWIHGGGHQFGSADTPYYQADSLPNKGVVLVTINYRLGAFGYMAHPAISADDPRGVSGNYGTLDQIAALKWVSDNIKAYGGDPDNVTIFGESAGSWSVTELMATPLAKGLFHKAIGQSGASTYHLGQMDGNETGWVSGYETAAKLDKALGLDNPSATELRALSADEIIKAVTWEIADGFHHVRDGVVFPENVGIAFRDGSFNAVPTLFGYNADEGTLFFPDDPQPSVWIEAFPTEGREDQIKALSEHYDQNAADIVDLYGLDDPKNFMTAGTQMMGDDIFGINARFVTRNNEATGQPAYMYMFDRIPPSKDQTLGAFHAAEIPFVFGSSETILGHSETDEGLTELMQTYWVNFASTGDPNGPDLPTWPTYKGQNWMQFGGNNDVVTGVIKDFRKEKLDALETGLLKKLEILSPSDQPSLTSEDQKALPE